MSYFQKYQKLTGNSRATNHTTESLSNQNNSTYEHKQMKQSSNSYLKAFKKYYIDQLVKKQEQHSYGLSVQNKQNFILHQPKRDNSRMNFCQQKSTKELENYKKLLENDRKVSQQTFNPKINSNKMMEIVTHRENRLQELIYNSISQIEREMMSVGESNQLLKQNKMLRTSIEKLKLILKEKLKEALAKNKQELASMFDQYSAMIKKLLQDKERLTNDLQKFKNRLTSQENLKKNMIESYQNQIKIVIQENHLQIANTKKQVQQFLDVITQYQEEASSEKAELDRLRQKLVELEMDNDKLKKEVTSLRGRDSSIQKVDDGAFGEEEISMFKDSDFNASESRNINLKNLRDKDEQLTNKYVTNRDSEQEDQDQIQRYAQKIQYLLDMLDKLQEENKELNDFLKSCKCSRITSKKMEGESTENLSAEALKKTYQKKMIQAEKDFIREEMGLRQALRKKDECIERLTLVIQQMRKARYESVDRITQQAARAFKK